MEYLICNNFIIFSYVDVRGVGGGRCDFCPDRSGAVNAGIGSGGDASTGAAPGGCVVQ